MSCSVSLSLLYFLERGSLIEPGCRLTTTCTVMVPVSTIHTQCWGSRCEWPQLDFYLGAEIQTQTLLFVQQVLFPWRYLSGPHLVLSYILFRMNGYLSFDSESFEIVCVATS